MPLPPQDDAFPSGSWELPEEFRMLQDTVRRFVEKEVRPVEDRLPHDSPGAPADELRTLQEKARALGLWALQTPRQFGGAGLSVLGQVVVAEEAAKCRTGAFFPAAGAGRAFTAISEPSGGSDPARAIQCRADRDGDHYVLNGTKMRTTHAGTADWGIVYARTGAPGDRAGISCFIVESSTPGLTKRPIEVMNSYSPYELHFEDALVPVTNRVGPEGGGFSLASEFLVQGRIVYASGPIGIAQYALELAIDWVKQRQVFGSVLADKQAIQFMLADSEIELRAARLLVYQAAWSADLGRDVRVEASIAKVFGTETAFRVLDRCMQMFGAMGLSKEMPLERWSEVQRMIVARELLRGRPS